MQSLIPDDISPGNIVRIITVNGHKFVTGLFWQPLTNPRAYMNEARQIGKKRNWDIVAIRKGIRIQAGFVNKNAGVMKGMYSLAATLAGQLGDSWIGAFPVGNDEYAVFAVHDGSIVPGYDLVADRALAIAKLKEGYGIFQYPNNHIYAPADFEFSQFEHHLETLLISKNLKNEYRLKQLTFGLTKQELLTVGVCTASAIICIYGWVEYTAYKAKKIREEQIQLEQLRQAELARLNANSRTEQDAEALRHPWAAQPTAVDFITTCSAEILALPLNIAGWQIEGAKCDTKSLTATYKRNASIASINTFIDRAEGVCEGTPLFTEDGETATLRRTVKMLFGGDETVAPATKVKHTFLSYFQVLDVRLKLIEKTITPPVAPPVTPPGQQPASAPQAAIPDWKMFNYEFETPITPKLLIEGLPDTNGVRITKLEMRFIEDDPSLKWTVTGELYASK
jgi:hypothetical protein